MPTNALPTNNPEALRTFISGNEQFQAYLTSGDGNRLKAAEQSFATASSHDPKFQLAVFYRSLAQSELRDADSAIRGFGELLAAGVKFETEVLIHLAYAHIKRYTDEDYLRAKDLFGVAREQAAKAGRSDLQLLIDALIVFLFAVMGGRLSNIGERPVYLDRALSLGEQLLQGVLRDSGSGEKAEVRFEVMNGIGIAHMRKGAAAEDSSEKRQQWARAAECFEQALSIRPSSVRVMHNMGTLYGMQALHERTLGNKANFEALMDRAKTFLRKSITLNSNDQFPHFKLSQLCALTGDWTGALDFLKKGREKHGAVKEKEWADLQLAIESRNSSGIHW